VPNVLLGVDISEWQGAPDWARVASSGITFAFARATYGAHHTDLAYGRNRVAIPAVGLVPGAYHYLTAGPDAVQQADAFCGLADPAAMHALDVEAASVDVESWTTRYRVHYPDHPLIIYTGRDLWRAAVGSMNGGGLGSLWLAGVVPNAYVAGAGSLAGLWAEAGRGPWGSLPWGGWTSASFVQFTDSAQVPGVAGAVDGDAFLGTLDDLHALTGATDMPLSDADLAKLSGLIDARIAAALPSIAKATQTYYQVHTASGLKSLDDAVSMILSAVTGLTPAAVVAAVTAALPAGTAPADVEAIAGAVASKLNVRAALADVLLRGASTASTS
jgi:lysozyme